MGDLFSDERENVQSAREALLKSYSSKSAAHGTYILTAIIAVLTVFQIFPPATTRELPQIQVASVILGALLTFIFQMGMRAVYWGTMMALVMCVKPSEEKDIEEGMLGAVAKGKMQLTVMYRLEHASAKLMRKRHSGFFACQWVRRIEVWISLLAIFCIFSFLIYRFWVFWIAL